MRCSRDALAVLVRAPSALLLGATPEQKAAFSSEQGLPYLIDMDSYYHVRIVGNDIDHGHMGDTLLEDGTSWDTKSFFPEGRSAQYQPGIVKLTEAVWGPLHALFGVDLYAVEYCLSAFMAALVALAAFLLGHRMAGLIGGLVAGVLVACAPAFVLRTAFGRYDTDMFVVLMDVLLVLTLTEALRVMSPRLQVAFSLGFGVTLFAYALSWVPQYAIFLAGLLLAGALLYVAALTFAPQPAKGSRTRLRRFIASPELRAFGLCALLAVLVTLVLEGPGFFAAAIPTLLWSAEPTASAVLPNMLASISELEVPQWVPDTLLQCFGGYIPGAPMTVLNGVGGIVPAVLAFAALVWLVVRSVKPQVADGAWPLQRRTGVMYLLIMGVFFVGGLYVVGRGTRFIEHLAVPVGVLAGAFAGWLALGIGSQRWRIRAVAPVFTAILCLAVVAPSLVGSVQICVSLRPSASDACARGMAWVRDHAEDPQAVIASWWDDGYFFESASGHPCLWDGGSQNGVRAILVAKALESEDPALSASIFRMLAHSGNGSVEYLMERTDAPTAFSALWEALPLDTAEARAALQARCGFTLEEAMQAEALMHPAEPKEVYLVLTDAMLSRTGWFERYANWDFGQSDAAAGAEGGGGDGGGRGDEGSPAPFSDKLLQRLFVNGDAVEGFAPVFDEGDGVKRMAIWRVM